jgi:hypothetical protein
MRAVRSERLDQGGLGLSFETFCEDPLRLRVNLAKRMSMRETAAFALLKKHLFALARRAQLRRPACPRY